MVLISSRLLSEYFIVLCLIRSYDISEVLLCLIENIESGDFKMKKTLVVMTLSLLASNVFAKKWMVCDAAHAFCKTIVKTAYNFDQIGKIEKAEKLLQCQLAKRDCNRNITEALKGLNLTRD